MLKLTIPETELFDHERSKIVRLPPLEVRLEHSLLSMSKWETSWEIPFQSKVHRKTRAQLLDYIESMELDEKVDFAHRLTDEQFGQVNTYLNAKHSATWFNDEGRPTVNGQTVTSELVYYWMTAFGIPFECETWPLGRLMTLIKICMIKHEEQNKPKKKRSPSQMLDERAALNAKRIAEQNGRA